jgi:hypothetical protein
MSYGGRKISISGYIMSSSVADMDLKIDELKRRLKGRNKDLVFYVAGSLRKYVGTLEGFTTEVSGHHCKWDAIFSCDAFGVDIDATTLSFTTPFSDDPHYEVIDWDGTYNAKPILDFTINMCEPYWEARYIDIENTLLNRRLRLTRVWNWFDRFIVNPETKEVSLYETTKTIIDNCDSITGWTGTNFGVVLNTSSMIEGLGCINFSTDPNQSSASLQRLNGASVDLSPTAGIVIIPMNMDLDSGSFNSMRFTIGSDATLANNYCYWDFDDSVITLNEWSYLVIDLSETPTGSSGSVDREDIKSIQIRYNGTAFQISGNIDYITVQKAGVSAIALDYEGIFPEYEPGTGTIKISDEFDNRDISISGTYYKRYL